MLLVFSDDDINSWTAHQAVVRLVSLLQVKLQLEESYLRYSVAFGFCGIFIADAMVDDVSRFEIFGA